MNAKIIKLIEKSLTSREGLIRVLPQVEAVSLTRLVCLDKGAAEKGTGLFDDYLFVSDHDCLCLEVLLHEITHQGHVLSIQEGIDLIHQEQGWPLNLDH